MLGTCMDHNTVNILRAGVTLLLTCTKLHWPSQPFPLQSRQKRRISTSVQSPYLTDTLNECQNNCSTHRRTKSLQNSLFWFL